MGPSAELANRIGAAAKRPQSWLQLLKFALVGGFGYLINLAVFAGAAAVGFHHVTAALLAFAVAISNNFLLNRHWTFRAGGGGDAGFQAVRFLTVSLAGLAINLIVLESLIVGTSMPEVAAQAIAVAVAMPFNFIGNKLWTFAD